MRLQSYAYSRGDFDGGIFGRLWWCVFHMAMGDRMLGA